MFPHTRERRGARTMDARLNILLVDDDLDLLQTVADELRILDYDVTTAADGERAMALLAERHYDALILDLKLPKVGGMEVLEHVKTNRPATKVVVLTAYANLGNVERCKKLGADDVIEKPYELGDLFDALRFLLER